MTNIWNFLGGLGTFCRPVCDIGPSGEDTDFTGTGRSRVEQFVAKLRPTVPAPDPVTHGTVYHTAIA